MFQGPPLPLSPDVSLNQLLTLASSGRPLGAWVRASLPRLRIYQLPCSGPRTRFVVLASSDLGYLLGRCREVAVRERERTRVLPAEVVIQWRALQVATATPHLPGIQRLEAEFPGLQASVLGLLIPTRLQSPEEVLARCLAQGVRVMGSRVIYTCAAFEEVIPQ